jgi:flagellar motor protein MotB
MAKLFQKEKDKHIDVMQSEDRVLIFIQDDTSFPSKIVSIKLTEVGANILIKSINDVLENIGK